jgi:phage gp29-like protein
MKLIRKIAGLGRGLGKKPVLGEIARTGLSTLHRAYPSRGLTPESLSAALAEADEGRIERQAELYEEMEEKDAHLGSVIQTRKLAVLGLEWEVTPGADDGDGRRVAGFVREAFGRIHKLDSAMASLMEAAARGFSIAELIWEIEKGSAFIKELRPLGQGSFTFMGRAGALSPEPRLLTVDEPVYGEPLLPGKFAVHYATGRAVHPARAGAMRPCAWMYLFKNYTLKDWVVFSERFAQPMRVGKFGPGATEEDRRVLRQAVFNLGSDAAAVISESTVIELLEAEGRKGSAEVYERLASYCDRAMSKAVLGQTLTTEQSGGAYATAKVHESVRRDILEADSVSLARTMRAAVIRPLVEYNFGPGTPLPGFRFVHEPGGDLRELAETYAALASTGLSIPESHIRERFGIPLTEDMGEAADG